VEQQPLQLAYRQFIAAERASVSSDAQRLFWQAFLAHAADTKLPAKSIGNPDWTAHKSYRTLDESLTRDILELARGQGLPTSTVLLAAHFKMLALFSRSDDILTGASFNGRLAKPDGTQVRGMFLNTLPMRLQTMGDTWEDLLSRVYAAECMMLPFRRYPLAQILRVAGSRVRPSTLFSFHHFHSVRQVRESGIVDSMENVTDDSRTNVPLETAFIRSAEQADSLTMIIDIDATMFTSADAESFAAAYTDALTRMTRNVHAPHATMSVD
jgi:non-ribosomal peptide synthetase component F